ncbi:hypothetical protein HYH02_008494 [Chlamydomonas schloesseri]|uniref:Glycosyl transferase CAP10 domain-containing protein n=1 Tax=Chlamydomonas schloesseri TaxID=2026947 RepID=A0A835WFI4_9CHLO|nr:hypothetical protein HYH02_008494 [Chlamydomonas schloesseri]|eukprot:KAG2446503.1 hypothetical protein HYH02_008494 [Chlamydomonas schloesseri]
MASARCCIKCVGLRLMVLLLLSLAAWTEAIISKGLEEERHRELLGGGEAAGVPQQQREKAEESVLDDACAEDKLLLAREAAVEATPRDASAAALADPDAAENLAHRSTTDVVRRRQLQKLKQQQEQERWAEGADRGGGGGGNNGGRGRGSGGGGGSGDPGVRSYVLTGAGQARGEGSSGGFPTVTSTRLRYDWRQVVGDLQPILMAALGPEVAYWRRKRPTCGDLAATASQLAAAAPDNLRLVLLRNTPGNVSTATAPALSWHFLTPPRGAAAAPGALRPNASGRVRHAWPPLEPAPLGSCDFCHKQLAVLAKRLSGFLSKVAAAKAAKAASSSSSSSSSSSGGGVGSSGSSSKATAAAAAAARQQPAVPDMLFLVNAADNMQRFGRNSRVPLLSLIVSCGGGGDGWRAGGGTIQPPPQAQAAASGGSSSNSSSRLSSGDNSGSSSSLAEAVAEAVAAFLRRPELDDPLQLPALQGWLRRQVDKSVAGAAAAAATAAAASTEARPGGGGGESRDAAATGAAAAAVAAAARSGDAAAAAVAELDRMRLHGALDADMLLPNMAVVPRALHAYPWEAASDKAFFSGAPFCPRYKDTHGGDVCLRPYLAALAAKHPQDLEVRLTAPWQGPLGAAEGLGPPVRIDASPPTPLPDHARWRYLLAPDGYSASSRLGALMAGSSVLLKSRSPFIEWYYRLLTPGSHFLEFWTGRLNRDDVLRALAAARQAAAADPAGLQAAVAANRDIAARYLGGLPRLVYSQVTVTVTVPGGAEAALLVYHSLFGAGGGGSGGGDEDESGAEMRDCVADLLTHLQDLGRPLGRAGAMGAGGGLDTAGGGDGAGSGAGGDIGGSALDDEVEGAG